MSQTANWTIDKSRSYVRFAVKHLMFFTVNGEFKDFSGELAANDGGVLSSVTGVVPIVSVDTQSADRDEYLRTQELFEPKTYPEMRFRSTDIQVNGSKAVVKGDLTIKTETRPVTLEGSFSLSGNRATYALKTAITRSYFKLEFGPIAQKVGAVGDDVKLDLKLEMVKEG